MLGCPGLAGAWLSTSLRGVWNGAAGASRGWGKEGAEALAFSSYLGTGLRTMLTTGPTYTRPVRETLKVNTIYQTSYTTHYISKYYIPCIKYHGHLDDKLGDKPSYKQLLSPSYKGGAEAQAGAPGVAATGFPERFRSRWLLRADSQTLGRIPK